MLALFPVARNFSRFCVTSSALGARHSTRLPVMPWITPLLTGDEAAWSAAADQSPPRVRMTRARMDAKAYARFTYRILGETGPTRETITIRRSRGGTVLRRLSTKAAINPPGKSSVVTWRVPNALPYGAYVWCMTSRDAFGNTSALQCAPFTI